MFSYTFQHTLEIPGKGACAFGDTTLGPEGFHFHSHDYTELVIIISGSGLHHTESGTYPVRGGDVFVIPKGLGHGFSKTKALALFNIGYQSELTSFEGVSEIPSSRAFFDIEPQIPAGTSRATMLHLSFNELESVLEQLNIMKQELAVKHVGWEYAWYHQCSLLIMQIARIYAGRSSLESSVHTLLQITESISYMEQHLSERISLETLSAFTGFSKQYFLRQFKAHLKTTPMAYLLNLRLQKACRLLQQGKLKDSLKNSSTRLSISEIGYACGFEDSNYFCRIFHREMGVTPGAYRKKFSTAYRSQATEESRAPNKQKQPKVYR